MNLCVLSKYTNYIAIAAFFFTAWLMSSAPANASELSLSEIYGVAIKGYDPVAYFTKGKAMPGDRAHSFNWNEATWYFVNEKHRNMFAASPETYAPHRGGF